MKITFLSISVIISALLQAEALDISPLLSLLADAPVLGILLYLFVRQMNHHEKMTKEFLRVIKAKSDEDDE